MSVPYHHDSSIHNFKAAEIVIPYLLSKININSVLDIGCGTGTWLKVASDNGISDYLGVDGDWVIKNSLQIPNSNFKAVNLNVPLNVGRKFDLIICLEVGEHLNKDASTILVDSITRHGDHVLFSAAIPEQGGQNHINEQNFDFWKSIFNAHGYKYYDIFRPVFWNEKNIEWWYKQNMFLISRNDIPGLTESDNLNLYIHPDLFYKNIHEKNKLKIKINKILNGGSSSKIYLKLFLKSLFRF